MRMGWVPWSQTVVSPKAAPWTHRDGATLVWFPDAGPLGLGRLLLIGGWDTDGPWPDGKGGKDITTNEVWASDDEGVTWTRILDHAHNDDAPPGTQFRRVHTPAWTKGDDGYFYLIGGDAALTHSEVWRTPMSGPDAGVKWQRMTDNIHDNWQGRILSIAGCLNGKLYVMGGQLTEDPDTAQNDIYESSDGGVTWSQVLGPPWMHKGEPSWPPWSPRGMVHGMPVIDGKLYLVGGARYSNGTLDHHGNLKRPMYFDGVYAFDGTFWEVVRPDRVPGDACGWPTGYGDPITSGRGYHNVVWTPPGSDLRRSPHGLLGVITGSLENFGSSRTILTSEDKGRTWSIALEADWGKDGSHADGVTVILRTGLRGGPTGDRWAIIRASGNAYERLTYRISPTTLAEFMSEPPRPRVDRVDPDSGAADGDVTLTGAGFSSAVAVYVAAGGEHVVHAETFTRVSDTEFKVKMPPWPPGVGAVYILVVNPSGSSYYVGGAHPPGPRTGTESASFKYVP